MAEVLPKYTQMTLDLSDKSTCSLESQAGVSHSDKLDGQTIGQSGLDLLPVKAFQQQASSVDSMTNATSGLRCSGSSQSFNLSFALENKLRQRLHLHGGTLWQVTWKVRVTPQQRSICQAGVRVRPISDPDCIGSVTNWVTPQAIDSSGVGRQGRLKKDGNRNPNLEGSYRKDLKDQVLLAPWTTPTAQFQNSVSIESAAKETQRLGGSGPLRIMVVHQLASQPPSGMNVNGLNVETASIDQPELASIHWQGFQTWIESTFGENWSDVLKDYFRTGTMPIGVKKLKSLPSSFLKLEMQGQLNPAFAAWLMGYPQIWLEAATLAGEEIAKYKSSGR